MISASRLFPALRDAGLTSSEIEEVTRALNTQRQYTTRLRDEFAMGAYPVLYDRVCDILNRDHAQVENIYEIVAKAAYEAADAMMEARDGGR